MTDLAGRVALVTGAAHGQGRAHARKLAASGADVVLVDIGRQIASVPYPMGTVDELRQTAADVEALGRRAVVIEGDVRCQGDLDEAVTRGITELGGIDIVIANAGIWSSAPFWELTEEQWIDLIDVNLNGMWRTVKAVAPHLIERGRGAIVMTSSVVGFEAAPGAAHYGASKHAVHGLTQTMAAELAPHGVRCNAVAPGIIDTRMVNWEGAYDTYAGHEGGTRDDFENVARSFHALRGAGALDVDVVADAALWLVSDAASAVTGVVIPVDAGHRVLTGLNLNPS